MANVTVFIPAFGRQISTTTFESSHLLMSAFMQKGIMASISSFSWPDIEEVRNVMLSFWYDALPDSTHLLFIDADMGLEPQMVIDMLSFSEPMVGALYPKKTYPLEWVGSGTESPDFRKGFIEVEALGMGCFLIRRDAITAMIGKFPELIFPYIAIPEMRYSGVNRTLAFFDCMRTPRGKVSEDISFCRRYRAAGGKIWATTAYRIEHVGLQSYAACFAEERAKTMAKHQTKVCKHGKFTFNPNDTMIGRSLQEYGEWCEFEIDLLKGFVLPGCTVIDAGANIGTHALAFAEMVGPQGRVYAFEPQPRIEAILRENIHNNGLDAVVKAKRSALCSIEGTLSLADLPPDETPFNFGGVPLSAPSSGAVTLATTIDALVEADGCVISLIKIDVEGMEADVILGARATIAEHGPAIYLECNGDDTSKIAEALDLIGYRAYWSIGPYFNPDNFFGSGVNLWPTVMPSANLIALPADEPFVVTLGPEYLGAKDNWRRVVDGKEACAA